MNKKPELPSDILNRPTHRTRWIVAGVAAIAIVGAGMSFGPAIAAQFTPTSAHTAVAVAAPADEGLTAEELATVQGDADAQQATIAANAAAALAAQQAQAAADAAAQTAAEQAAKALLHSSATSGPVRCPAGTQANSNDGVNDTSCFPTIYFGITVPDPAHPECDVAFKP